MTKSFTSHHWVKVEYNAHGHVYLMYNRDKLSDRNDTFT